MGRITVGTSSWADPGFVEEWYPRGLPARDRLGWYADHFEAVELNASFYAVPDARTVARWVDATPKDFTFDVKLHRLLSRHSTKLEHLPPDIRDEATTDERGRVVLTPELETMVLDASIAAVQPLYEAGKLSTFLLQLSPAFEPHSHQLGELTALIERARPHVIAVELRHRAWVEGERLESTLGWLEEHGAAFVCTDSPQGAAPTMMPPVDAVTRDDVAYFRLHGRNAEGYLKGRTVAERFAWDYGQDELRELRGRVEGLAEIAQDVRTMFNNNRGADAPKAAIAMRELLGQEAAGPKQGTLL